MFECIKNSGLHDCEVIDIEVNYINGVVSIILKDLRQQMRRLYFNDFTYVLLENNRPWGNGNYVVFSDVYESEGLYNIEIQLNSGDICIIKCKKREN